MIVVFADAGIWSGKDMKVRRTIKTPKGKGSLTSAQARKAVESIDKETMKAEKTEILDNGNVKLTNVTCKCGHGFGDCVVDVVEKFDCPKCFYLEAYSVYNGFYRCTFMNREKETIERLKNEKEDIQNIQ